MSVGHSAIHTVSHAVVNKIYFVLIQDMYRPQSQEDFLGLFRSVTTNNRGFLSIILPCFLRCTSTRHRTGQSMVQLTWHISRRHDRLFQSVQITRSSMGARVGSTTCSGGANSRIVFHVILPLNSCHNLYNAYTDLLGSKQSIHSPCTNTHPSSNLLRPQTNVTSPLRSISHCFLHSPARWFILSVVNGFLDLPVHPSCARPRSWSRNDLGGGRRVRGSL